MLRGIVEGHKASNNFFHTSSTEGGTLKPKRSDTSKGTLQVLVLEASPTPGKEKHYTAHYPTVESRRTPLFLLNTNEIKAMHLCCQPLRGLIPDVRYNPKTHQKDWSTYAWEARALCNLDNSWDLWEKKPEGYHIFHTHGTHNRLYPNWFRPKVFNGNIYVLKFSKERKDGTLIYEDILPNATPHGEAELVEMLGHLMTEKGDGPFRSSHIAQP